ncbi:DUF5685 family protein [Micromonospora sp. WMMD1102]|uniref:DUF5685 family protein n=1 Tax=Micromonospora sp. WMMD1102 TaxID=3016105 RepID=UPI00241538FA|nr:DUF5685 family protein [Micromonospora sp. WMMD1102]MDG4786176.1 DUF5685 family protein [Micromonospora sp. WMMD1102]
MFGIVRPCRHRMCGKLHAAWLGHLCGLCLTLRDEHGHRARLATNYDGLLISVLLEAQRPAEYRPAGPCALRGFRSAPVLAPSDPGARLAAAVSLVLAAGKTRDHVTDRDGALRMPALAGVAGRLADGWAAAGARTGAGVGFDTGVLWDAVARQSALESAVVPGGSVLVATEPTETAVAAAFAHTATLAGRPGNAAGLAEVGRYFGRIAHLLDAVTDHADDAARGAFNPLLASGTDLAQARRLCADAHHGLRLALADLELRDRRLVRALLDREVGDAIERTFALAGGPGAGRQSLASDGRGDASHHGPDSGHGLPLVPHGRTAQPAGQTGEPAATRPAGCGGAMVTGGACVLTTCTCGLWQPRWSRRRREGCGDRCWCTRHCDCNCCDCCDCS